MYLLHHGKDRLTLSTGVRNGHHCPHNPSHQWEPWSVGDSVLHGNDFTPEDVSPGVLREVWELHGRNGLEVQELKKESFRMTLVLGISK